jgi:hypothetical protein
MYLKGSVSCRLKKSSRSSQSSKSIDLRVKFKFLSQVSETKRQKCDKANQQLVRRAQEAAVLEHVLMLTKSSSGFWVFHWRFFFSVLVFIGVGTGVRQHNVLYVNPFFSIGIC